MKTRCQATRLIDLKGICLDKHSCIFCRLRESTESKSDNVDACDMLKEGTVETAVAALEEVLQDKLISSAEFTM